LITIRQYAAGEAIFREQESGEAAFLIERGKVEVTRHTDAGPEHIGYLEAGSTFGEMGLVDDSPRSVSVTAVEETLVREIQRDNILAAMKESPEVLIKLLKDLFERLREANAQLARRQATDDGRAGPELSQAPSDPAEARGDAPIPAMEKRIIYAIEGITPRAIEAMSDNPFRFSAFPIKIGRKTNDELVNNHLEILDQDPLQISRHHVSIVLENGKLGVVDRGSQLGALVDGVRVGGKKNGPGPVFFKGDEGILVLGTDSSPYRYKVGIAT
jgi:CRP-like cAMP-binding protein